MSSAFLFACIAIAAIVAARKYLTWEAILGLGILITVPTGIAFLLDVAYPLVKIGEPTATGFAVGPSVSILGMGWGFFLVALVSGIALIMMALAKKEKEAGSPADLQQDNVTPVEDASEADRIQNNLEAALWDMRQSLQDPKEAGANDATREGGVPFPNERELNPPKGGYEHKIRERFEALGATFVDSTVRELKDGIKQAVQSLADVKGRLLGQSYVDVAISHYRENEAGMEISKNQVQKNQRDYNKAKMERGAFIKSLRLRVAEQPDWLGKRTTVKSLIIYGAIFALAEFIISWFFLKSQIGREQAILLAGGAVVIILILAFLAGGLFQFMRRNQPAHSRTLAALGYFAVCFFVFLGFGLLLNYREVIASGDITGSFDAILSGYASLTIELANLVVFLVNILALAIFYWKVLLFFDKFRGYKHHNDPFLRAKERWENMFEKSAENITLALAEADRQAWNNGENAKNAAYILDRKKEALAHIEDIIASAYRGILHNSYEEYVEQYRESNREHRAPEVNSAPAYFDDKPAFCDIKRHIAKAGNVEKFLTEYRTAFAQAEEDREVIEKAGQQWQSQRQEVYDKLTSDFESRIASAKIGAATESVSPNGNDQEDIA